MVGIIVESTSDLFEGQASKVHTARDVLSSNPQSDHSLKRPSKLHALATDAVYTQADHH